MNRFHSLTLVCALLALPLFAHAAPHDPPPPEENDTGQDIGEIFDCEIVIPVVSAELGSELGNFDRPIDADAPDLVRAPLAVGPRVFGGDGLPICQEFGPTIDDSGGSYGDDFASSDPLTRNGFTRWRSPASTSKRSVQISTRVRVVDLSHRWRSMAVIRVFYDVG